MMRLCKFGKMMSSAVVVALLASVAYAQTGPGPAAAKHAIEEDAVVKPKNIFDEKAAAKIWNIKPKTDETTSAMYKRVDRMLRRMIANTDDLDYDTSYWRLLAYVREVPWNKLTDYRKNWYLKNMPNPRLTDEQRDYLLQKLRKKQIYEMTPKEVDLYLGYMHEMYPELRKRVVALARQDLGQPYAIYLLGEFPREVYDADPMFCLTKGDCVTFAEHMYSMALGHDWPTFYSWLQRIRYKDGVPGMTTRNHYTEADWDINNNWLVEDVTTKLDATTVTKYSEKIDRARFFRNFGIGQDFKVQHLNDEYIPAKAISSVLDKLQDGDFVNIVRGFDSGVWVGHVGLIGHGKDGKVTFINSTYPKSVEVPIMEYINDNLKKNVKRHKKGSAEFKGMKFLRLRADKLQDMLLAGKGPDDVGKTAIDVKPKPKVKHKSATKSAKEKKTSSTKTK